MLDENTRGSDAVGPTPTASLPGSAATSSRSCSPKSARSRPAIVGERLVAALEELDLRGRRQPRPARGQRRRRALSTGARSSTPRSCWPSPTRRCTWSRRAAAAARVKRRLQRRSWAPSPPDSFYRVPGHEPSGPDGGRADLARRALLRHLLAPAQRADRLPRNRRQRRNRQPDRRPAPPPRVGGPGQGHQPLRQLARAAPSTPAWRSTTRCSSSSRKCRRSASASR